MNSDKLIKALREGARLLKEEGQVAADRGHHLEYISMVDLANTLTKHRIHIEEAQEINQICS